MRKMILNPIAIGVQFQRGVANSTPSSFFHQYFSSSIENIGAYHAAFMLNFPKQPNNFFQNLMDFRGGMTIPTQITLFWYKKRRKLSTQQIKYSENYRSDVIHKITHSNTTTFQFYTLSILHSTNPTLFQSYTLQSYTLPISHSSNPTPF